MKLGRDTVTIRRATKSTNAFGNATPDWSTATSTTVTDCSVQPVAMTASAGRATESLIGRDTVVTVWELWAPDGTDLVASDRVEFAGDTYDVDGEVGRWESTRLQYVTAVLRKSRSA